MGVGTERSHVTVEIPKIQLGGGATYHPLPAQCHCHTRSAHAGAPVGVWTSLQSCLGPTVAPQDSFTTQKFHDPHLSPPLGKPGFATISQFSQFPGYEAGLTQCGAFLASSFYLAMCSYVFSILVFLFLWFGVLGIGSQLCESKQGSAIQQPSCLSLPSSFTCVFHYVWLFMSFHGSVVQFFLITK